MGIKEELWWDCKEEFEAETVNLKIKGIKENVV